MNVLCRMYTNNVRLEMDIARLSKEPGFRLYSLHGRISENNGAYRVHTSSATVCISIVSEKSGKTLVSLLTTEQKYASHNGKYIDLDTVGHDDVYPVLCGYMLSKFATTGSPFSVVFSKDKHVLEVTSVLTEDFNPELVCTVRGTSGEVVVYGMLEVQSVLCNCERPRSFSYNIVTEEMEKSVSVKKSVAEIYKAMATYLNRTIVLISMSKTGEIVEQYYGSRGTLEVVTKKNGSRYFKRQSPSDMRNLDPFCIYTTTSTVEDIANEQSRVLRKSSNASKYASKSSKPSAVGGAVRAEN